MVQNHETINQFYSTNKNKANLNSLFSRISTACSKGNLAQSGGKAYTENPERAMSNRHDQTHQSFKGGINGYDDDVRYDSEIKAKTKTLIDQAKAQKKDNVGDYVGNIADQAQDKIEQAQKDIPRAIQAKKEDAVQGIQERTSTLKNNLENAPDEAKRIFSGGNNT